MKQIELERCRVCGGGKPQRWNRVAGGVSRNWVECGRCHIRTKYHARTGEAAKDWNRLMRGADKAAQRAAGVVDEAALRKVPGEVVRTPDGKARMVLPVKVRREALPAFLLGLATLSALSGEALPKLPKGCPKGVKPRVVVEPTPAKPAEEGGRPQALPEARETEEVMRDWIGNGRAAQVDVGASQNSQRERSPLDYYATPPEAVGMLLDVETFARRVWEPACGEGHIVRVLLERGHEVRASDLILRAGMQDAERRDFLLPGWLGGVQRGEWDGDIITNPPYNQATDFVLRALEAVRTGAKVAMFLKLQFLAGKDRRARLFEAHPPARVWVSSRRLNCLPNGRPELASGSMITYAWYVWEKGRVAPPELRWFN